MIAIERFLVPRAAFTKALATACAVLVLHLSLASGWSQTPIISEFMAENDNTLDDENGDSSDWIEIYNPTVVSWNLDGWFLTDDARNPTKWRFPSVTLNPSDFLVVFASGKNRTNATGRLHTNFGLSDTGEYLGLIQPDGISVATQFAPTYPTQSRDVSYGSLMVEDAVQPDPPTRLAPTPGRPNPAQDYGSSPPPVQFSRSGGTFVQPFSLTLSMGRSAPATTIHYELVTNGQFEFTATNVPTTSSPIYSSSLWIDRPVQVRARAFSSIPGTSPSVIKTETYLPITTNLAAFQSTLPLVVIHTIGPTFNIYFGVASVSVAFFDTEAGFASLANRPSLIRRAGLNVLASDTLGAPKDTYALELWDEFNQDDKAPVLGLPEESDWVLYGPYFFDRSYLQNPLVYELSRNLGRYAPRTRFVEVFLNSSSNAVTFPDPTNPVPTNAGSYRGVYVLEEKVKRADSRVNIDRLAPAQITEPDLTGGYLLKIDRFDRDDLSFSTARSTIIFEDPDGRSTPPAQLDYIRRYFSLFDTSTISPGYTNFTGTNHYSHYVDLDAAIDHHLLNVLCLNAEAFQLNSFLYKPRNGRITMGPVWDFDRALGSADERTFNPWTWRSTAGTDFFNIPIPPNWASLFGDTDFFQRWIDRYQELRAGQWATNRLASLIDSLANQVRAAQPRDAARWGTAASPRTGTVTSGGYSHTFPGSHQGEVDFLKRWLLDRVGFMDTQFLSRPIVLTEPFASNGSTLSRVSAVHPAGLSGTEIYFTLDGTDPRASQNLTNGSAQRYTGSFVVDTSVRVAARAINKTEFRGNLSGLNNPPLKSFWSGLSQLSVTGRPPSLRITEIMYHPAPVPPGSAYTKEDFQFIELKNTGTTPIRMGGIRFTSGIDFTFPSTNLNPGAYALLVKNRTAFEQRHGTGHPVAGEFTGTLALGGERLTLEDLIGQTILDFDYSDLWYPLTDGPGLSLVANVETAAPNVFTLRRGWRASRLIHGSPGGPEPDTIPFAPVVINELLSNSQSPYEDAVELHNPTGTEADISHWYLTDEFNQPQKFQFPPGTTISPHGFQAFDEHSFNPFSDPPLPTSFSFNANGESVFLFSASEAGDLTGYVHGFRFGASGTNVTFGRFLGDDGQEMFLAQSEISFGLSNSVPRAVPVGQRPTLALTEIMHDPVPAPFTITNAPGELEFIEIKNIGLDTIDLTAAQFVSGITFTFPAVELAPGQYALIVKNRPAFASRYGTNLPVVGEYSGGLASEGERLVLIGSTGDPVLDFTYDSAPFPLTKGIGFSLVLRDERSPRSSYSSTAIWRTGSIEGGTPGYAEPKESWQPILINEVEVTRLGPPNPSNTGSHQIELFNPTTNVVDVGGWFFTDDFTGPLRVPIPAPTMIPPGGFFVINNISLPGLRSTGSGLFSRVGLVSADPSDGRRTGYLVELEAGPGLAGTSFGPHRISTGEQRVVPLASQTFGASNTGLRVGPIVLSEIHYHPVEEFVGSLAFDNTRDEYIELSNISPNTVPLFDSATPAYTWSLSGDVFYPFPIGTTIPPGGLVLLVGFNPADVTASNRFNATFFPPPSTRIYGPWIGNLKNSSGSIELIRAAPNSDTARMDHLHYSNVFPWPSAADGTGAALRRVNTFAYGDDPASWRAMSPSPGRANSGDSPPVISSGPVNTTGSTGGTARFEVFATGTTTLSYRWFHDGQAIPGATSNVLQLQNLRLEDAGRYHVVVFNNGGVSTSDDADLMVRIGPGFTRQPTNISVRIPPDPAAAPATNVLFQVTVTTANPPLVYQWHFNGVNIPGATNDSLLVTNVSLADEGLYACVAADGVGTLVSAPARLTPLIKPQITVPPLSQRVITGTTFFVSATFLGHPLPFVIEWRKGTTVITSNSVPRLWDFGSFTAPTNLVTNQMYRLVVKNEAYPAPGVAATFYVTTLLDSDADGLPDEFETAHGLNSADAVDATLDSDGDLMSNSAEYIAGTDPLDPFSYLSIEPPTNVDALTGATVRFLAVSNRTYSVEARSANESSPWLTIAGAVAFPTNRMVSIVDPLPAGTNTHRTYRLVTPHQTNP